MKKSVASWPGPHTRLGCPAFSASAYEHPDGVEVVVQPLNSVWTTSATGPTVEEAMNRAVEAMSRKVHHRV